MPLLHFAAIRGLSGVNSGVADTNHRYLYSGAASVFVRGRIGDLSRHADAVHHEDDRHASLPPRACTVAERLSTQSHWP